MIFCFAIRKFEIGGKRSFFTAGCLNLLGKALMVVDNYTPGSGQDMLGGTVISIQ